MKLVWLAVVFTLTIVSITGFVSLFAAKPRFICCKSAVKFRDCLSNEKNPSLLFLALQEKMSGTVDTLRASLVSKQATVNKLKAEISESGKPGVLLLQAQAANFLRQSEEERKTKRTRSKVSLVTKLISMMDAYRTFTAKSQEPFLSSEETLVNKTFSQLFHEIAKIFLMNGVVEYFPEIGTSFDPSKQQTNELIDSNSEDKCVVAGILQPGYKFKNGTVVRPAMVTTRLKHKT